MLRPDGESGAVALHAGSRIPDRQGCQRHSVGTVKCQPSSSFDGVSRTETTGIAADVVRHRRQGWLVHGRLRARAMRMPHEATPLARTPNASWNSAGRGLRVWPGACPVVLSASSMLIRAPCAALGGSRARLFSSRVMLVASSMVLRGPRSLPGRCVGEAFISARGAFRGNAGPRRDNVAAVHPHARCFEHQRCRFSRRRRCLKGHGWRFKRHRCLG